MAVYAASGIGMHDEESENRDAWSLETVAVHNVVLSYRTPSFFLFSFFYRIAFILCET